jgi:16S rRNA G966 N2-methylase RsmD
LNISRIYTEEVKQFVQDHLEGDPALLFMRLRDKVSFDLKLAIHQVESRRKAQKKLPNWSHNFDLFFPPGLSVEQSSSEDTAQFKSELVQGKSMIDLTGGFGVDTYYLARNFKEATYCEQNADLAGIFRYNMEVLGENKFKIHQGDGIEFLAEPPENFDLIYVDPARRGEQNQKLYKLSDCEPDTVSHWPLLQSKARSVLVKASPMMDIKQSLQELPDIQQVWVVSVKNEVKEVLLLWEKDKKVEEITIHCVDLRPEGRQEFDFSFEKEAASESDFSEVKSYIIEPNAGILKAGAFKYFGQLYGLEKLHPNSHLYTSDSYSEGIPGRVFEVIKELHQPKKELKTLFPKGQINVIARNFALSPEEIKNKFKLKDGGNDFLICTKVGEKYRVFHCRKMA